MNINRIKGIASGTSTVAPTLTKIEAELLKIGFVSHSFVSNYDVDLRKWNWSCDILRKKE